MGNIENPEVKGEMLNEARQLYIKSFQVIVNFIWNKNYCSDKFVNMEKWQ